jgi:hypothetical protein
VKEPPYPVRSRDELRSFFDGLEWVEPGFVSVPLWRPQLGAAGVARLDGGPEPIDQYGGVAREP